MLNIEYRYTVQMDVLERADKELKVSGVSWTRAMEEQDAQFRVAAHRAHPLVANTELHPQCS